MTSNQTAAIAAAQSNNVGSQFSSAIYNRMMTLMNMPDSLQAIDDAISMVGVPIASKNGGGDWPYTGILKFYALVKYLKAYPLPNNSTQCTQIKTALVALDGEITNIDNQITAGGTDPNEEAAFTYAVTSIKTAYQAWYAKTNCDTVIANQATTAQQQTEQSTTSADAALVNGSAGNSTPVIISPTASYIVGGLVVFGIIGTIVLIIVKHNKNNK